MAPCTIPLVPATFTPEELNKARELHLRLHRWAEKVLCSSLRTGDPVRYVVARVGTDGLTYLMDPELGHFTAVPGHVMRFDSKKAANDAMAKGYDVMATRYSPKVAGIYWNGQRTIPVHNDLEDLP